MTTRIRTAMIVLAAGAATIAGTIATAEPAAAGRPGPAGPRPAATVAVGRTMAELTPGAVGVDEPIWNPAFTAAAVPGLIRAAGIQTLEFNGGGVSDLYHWKTRTAQADPDPAGHPDYASLPPQFSFDEFEKVARQTGAHTLVHVNYGTGTPGEAAAWVKYAKQHHDHVDGWAIGEETWGNGGIAGIDFEPDAHVDKSPEAYGRNALAYITAMKAADPSARIGVELLGVQGGAFQAWDQAVMRVVGKHADFVDIHAYPFGADDTSDAAVLAQPRAIPAKLAAVRQLVDHYASERTQIVVGETNSATIATPQQIGQVNALYLADDMLSLLESGAADVDWWALHNGGFAVFGRADLGLLSTGDCNDDNTVCAPCANTPFRPYYALQLVGAMARGGGTMLQVTSSDQRVIGHAVRNRFGEVFLLLENDDPRAAVAVHLDTHGYRVRSAVRYGSADSRPQPTRDATVLPPYSLTLIELDR